MVLCFPILFNRLFTVCFVVHMASDLSSGSPQAGVTDFLTCPCPLPGTTRCVRSILCFSCLGLKLSHLSKEPWFFSVRNGIQEQDLGFVSCHWVVTKARPTHIYICICFYRY